MPAYDFRCKACLHVFELRASLEDHARGLTAACPACDSADTVQMISAAGFVGAGKREPSPQPTAGASSCGCGAGGCCS